MSTRIELHMNMQDVVMAMSDGNPGAITTCIELIQKGPTIDPTAWHGGLAVLTWADMRGIYGSRLYQVWNDVCGRNVSKMIALTRANQLGQLAGITDEVIDHAIDHWGQGIDWKAVFDAVMDRLPEFKPQFDDEGVNDGPTKEA